MIKRVIVGMLVACVACTGCGKKLAEKVTEKMIEKSMEKDGVKGNVKISDGKISINATDKNGKKADVDISGEKVTVKSADGTASYTAGSSAKLPDNFPKDVYAYDGATVLAVVTVPEGCNISLQTKDAADKVLAAYKAKMTANNWKEEATYSTAQQSMVSYKKENRTANVMIVSADGNTQINLTVMQEKK